MLVMMADGSTSEAGTVGFEGMAGAQSAFGSPMMLERWIDRVSGTAARMPMPAFHAHFAAFRVYAPSCSATCSGTWHSSRNLSGVMACIRLANAARAGSS